MTDRTLPLTAILGAGLGLGLAGDQLLRVSGGPGLNFSLLFLGLAASVWTVTQRSDAALGKEAWSWLGLGVLCGLVLMWRGSDLLRFATFVAACAAFAVPALKAGRNWTRRSGVLDFAEAGLGAGLHAAFGSFRLMDPEQWRELEPDGKTKSAGGVIRVAVTGGLIALVPLVIFGALFVSADQVFASLLSDVFRFDLEALGSHILGTLALAWLACGYLVGVTSGTALKGLPRGQAGRPLFGVPEVATAMGLVDVLFATFVVIQARYLFGGTAWVEVTPGLTYAEYARAGFFQLVVAVGLAVPWLLACHSLLGDRSHGARAAFRGFAGVHVVLLLVIVASAVMRMRAYQTAYGLSEDRIVGSAILLWLSLVILWFGGTVFSGRRDRFAFGAVVMGYIVLGGLHLMNPAGLAARHNLSRTDIVAEVDFQYLVFLGSDAVPSLLPHVTNPALRNDELNPEDQCFVATRLISKWGPGEESDWRTYNWSESQARAAVQNRIAELRALALPDGEGAGNCYPDRTDELTGDATPPLGPDTDSPPALSDPGTVPSDSRLPGSG